LEDKHDAEREAREWTKAHDVFEAFGVAHARPDDDHEDLAYACLSLAYLLLRKYSRGSEAWFLK
jgi:hypothetical protein